MSERRTFYVQNFGCRATQADGAAITADLSARGLQRDADWSAADVVVVNTCTVTAEADSDARQTIRRIHRENPSAEILVTGCYAQRRPEELSRLPGVRWVVGNSHKPQIGEVVAPQRLVSLHPSHEAFHGGVAAGGLLVGDISQQRQLLTAPFLESGQDRSRPNLKVQDGCNNRCTFCIIPSVRGLSRSAPPELAVAEMRKLARTFPEVVLTGINLGRWGRDLPGRPRFHTLLERLLAETPIRKIRVSSVEPMDWTQDLLELLAAEPRLAKHVHIPLQSGCDTVLQRMRRRYRIRHYADRIERARALMPEASIGADVMVGFPGETDAEFEQSRAFIEQAPFTYLHVFTYSAREGTPAAAAPGQVSKPVKKERNRALRELIDRKRRAFRRSLAGREVDAVTLARPVEGGGAALTDNYLEVTIPGEPLRPAQLVRVRLEPDAATARLV
ncbi:MAG: tRNA (N(6)-L-threonylcarbamoyladenosine(37)-C(2))-methylthiotransferase MtaB [Acidobacteria bacterium]|nr:tRNA (N(6)-L-threonylcarbamoyladenosine(37)-C(2))-methylthiotransferase MtaB [Acidobacteriota bacterium]